MKARAMAVVEKTVLVPFTAEQMFDLVDEVERYPEFLPWCGRSHVEFRDGQTTRATLQINYHGIKQSFSTQNANTRPGLIDIRLVSGPFRKLLGSWRFTPLGDAGCKIAFCLEYEFASGVLEKIVGPVFSHIANTFVDAFARRAEQLYG
jgi:ribosome-associated toxin RatA of RatAB toxin-antitoxin module